MNTFNVHLFDLTTLLFGTASVNYVAYLYGKRENLARIGTWICLAAAVGSTPPPGGRRAEWRPAPGSGASIVLAARPRHHLLCRVRRLRGVRRRRGDVPHEGEAGGGEGGGRRGRPAPGLACP